MTQPKTTKTSSKTSKTAPTSTSTPRTKSKPGKRAVNAISQPKSKPGKTTTQPYRKPKPGIQQDYVFSMVVRFAGKTQRALDVAKHGFFRGMKGLEGQHGRLGNESVNTIVLPNSTMIEKM